MIDFCTVKQTCVPHIHSTGHAALFFVCIIGFDLLKFCTEFFVSMMMRDIDL